MAGLAIQGVAGIVALVCFILVVVAMFNHGQTGLGIACIVLIFCGIGGLLAFIYGWIKAGEWNLKNVMIVYTIAFVVGIIGEVVQIATMPAGGGGFPKF